MARYLFALLLLSACADPPKEGASYRDDPSAGTGGKGTHTVDTLGGSGGAQSLSNVPGAAGSDDEPSEAGGTGGIDTVYTPGGSAGQTTLVAGSSNGGTSAGGSAPSAGGASTGGSGGSTSIYGQCGDGTCIAYELPGNIAPCPADCWGTCNNGIKEPQDLWTCPADGTPATTPPAKPGWIVVSYSTTLCDAYGSEPMIWAAYCDASQTACLDDWAAKPSNAKGRMCWNGVQPHNVPSANTATLEAPPGTYTVSAAFQSSVGIIHIVNARNVVVTAEKLTTVTSP